MKNAIATYEQIATFEPYSLTSLCNAPQLLMNRLIKNAEQIRNTEVRIVKGKEIAHITPPAQLVKHQLKDLLDYVENNPDLLLIKSCMFHYEFEFTNPFVDGNGRMGRLWQTVLLRQQYPVFDFAY